MKQDSDLTRQERISKTFQQRRKNLCLVLDNLSEELNISAILRSAEGFGVGEVVILHSKEKTPKLSKNTSKGAIKWLNLTFATNATKELNRLKKSGFAIVATIVDPQAEKVWAVDFAGKIALVVGNEGSQKISS
ncbi:MAG: hypothetical protein M1607_04645, partial [Patescibacteria group bacterium]|nr:hypothetical protein [Patescibacteria group bacterium]